MIKEPQVSFYDLISSLSSAMDLVDTSVVNHQKRVAYIALFIAMEMGLAKEECAKILLAGLLHDCGVLSSTEKISAIEFEFSLTRESEKHCIIGQRFLNDVPFVSDIASLVRHHHARWNERESLSSGETVPLGAYILHLADRVEVLINRREEILGQVPGILKRIESESGRIFNPDAVEVLKNISGQECFWLDLVSPYAEKILARKLNGRVIEINLLELMDIAKLFYKIIDFRSRFTATHSMGVATGAEFIAGLAGFSQTEQKMMRIAGYLHDLGKLAVPTEILEKNGALNNYEARIMKSHTYYTYRILESINGMETINSWASFHHERLNGNGYPFHIKGNEISLGSRILAVADVVTALTEDRPYRTAMTKDKALGIIHKMVNNNSLDSYVVHLLTDNYDDVTHVIKSAQENAFRDFLSMGSVA